MNFYTESIEQVLSGLNSTKNGLNNEKVGKNREKFGENVITEKKKKTLIEKILCALKEPMLLILIFSFIITFGINLGRQLKTGNADFTECFGILFAVVLSVFITLIMEGSSEKAFAALSKIYDDLTVKVIREDNTVIVRQKELVVGDVVLLDSGDKIAADGRLIESNELTVDESALTGESVKAKKDANKILPLNTVLAERENLVYSGTFVASGSGKMVVTSVGNNTEMGKIAGEISVKGDGNSPLNEKLNKLGKKVTLIGTAFAVLVFILSVVKLIITGTVTFDNVQSLFISCIVLIVAAVPEGLPTIVAVSLALNMIKLARENALIKKMIATETAGACSVICTDKTGTLTENKMKVLSFCNSEFCEKKEIKNEYVLQNIACNSTVKIIKRGKEYSFSGSGTETALTEFAVKTLKADYKKYQENYGIIERKPFTSETKMMSTTIFYKGKRVELVKGAYEKIFPLCNINGVIAQKLLSKIETLEREAKRIICFCHKVEDENYVFDGYAVLSDGIREEVYRAVEDCKSAKIKIKMLTGDNALTAYSIAKELKIASSEREVINAEELDKLDDESFIKALNKITVIARSTPIIKLRVVKALKKSGEVVAVTGDGINDAPAIKQADVGFAMGKSGSEITKEAADVVLLDDSFSTVVKAISFGRNVYRNLQRFILFQLSVNLSALLFITVYAIMGLDSPFNTLQLLWINVIMDGPPALTLGLESASKVLMKNSPVKRNKSIVSLKMLIRIIFNGVFISGIMIIERLTNFLNIPVYEQKSFEFTLFIMFQLFNAFNSRELGSESIFKNLKSNKIMVITFGLTFLVHFVLVQFLSKLFGVCPLNALSWIKAIITAFSIVVISEIYKFVYRIVKKRKESVEKTEKPSKILRLKLKRSK